MRQSLFAIACIGVGYAAGYWTQRERLALVEARVSLLEERVANGRSLLDRLWVECVGVEKGHGPGK